MKIYCDTNQFLALTYCGLYPKPHEARGLSNHYHLRLNPKLGHGICAVHCIPCACVACKQMLDRPIISGIPLKKQARTNISQIVLTDQFWTHIKIEISLI